MQSQRIFIYGVPGSGKTTYSQKLHQELGYAVIEADGLRAAMAHKEKTPSQDPFVYTPTTEAYRHFGELNSDNVIKGMLAVRQSMTPYVKRAIDNQTSNFIMESAFLDPNALGQIGQVILLVSPNESRHREQFFQHRELNDNNQAGFLAARLIQDYFMSEAKNLPVTIIENNFEL